MQYTPIYLIYSGKERADSLVREVLSQAIVSQAGQRQALTDLSQRVLAAGTPFPYDLDRLDLNTPNEGSPPLINGTPAGAPTGPPAKGSSSCLPHSNRNSPSLEAIVDPVVLHAHGMSINVYICIRMCTYVCSNMYKYLHAPVYIYL